MTFWKKIFPSGVDIEISYSSLEDQKLIELWVETGDKRAQAGIYNRYKKELVGFAYNILKDKNLAEDLSQETFLKLLISPGKLIGVTDLKKYLIKFTYNLIRNQNRLEKRTVSYEENFDGVEADIDYFEQTVSNIHKKMIDEIVLGLKAEYREAIELTFAGLNVQEVADEMKIPKKWAENYIRRAYKKIIEEFRKRLGE